LDAIPEAKGYLPADERWWIAEDEANNAAAVDAATSHIIWHVHDAHDMPGVSEVVDEMKSCCDPLSSQGRYSTKQ
jgi:hypothetical protein